MLRTIHLTPEQVQDLTAPYSSEHAKVAMMAGFAFSISQAGLLPSQAEEALQKFAGQQVDGWAPALLESAVWNPLAQADSPNGIKKRADGGFSILPGADTVANVGVWAPLGLGALGGAYSAYARQNMEHDFNDRGHPDLVALKQKIKAYRTMSDDLRRTNRVEGDGQAIATA